MKVLNLYAGVGGNRKLWEGMDVTSVENNDEIASVYHELFPQDTLVVGDAHQYLLDHHEEFDVIWSSPPCQTHSKMNKFTRHKISRYPDMALWQEIVFLREFFDGKWVVENVEPYYGYFIHGTSIGRHIFWSNVGMYGIVPIDAPENFINTCDLAGKIVMMDWLGIHFSKNIYYGMNHCPVQILRNCVHPELGKQIMDRLMKKDPVQCNLFDPNSTHNPSCEVE